LTDLFRLILDTLNHKLALRPAALGVFFSYLPAAGAGDGLHQLITDPELEQLVGDQHVATLPGAVFAHRDLLPADADDAVAPDLAGDPAVAVSAAAGRWQWLAAVCAAAVAGRRLGSQPGRLVNCVCALVRLAESLRRGRIVERLMRPGGVVVDHHSSNAACAACKELNVRRVSNSARRLRWNRSILPVVVGDRGWVNKCSMPFSRQIRSNNTSTGGVAYFPVNTLPLSVKICCGTP
jgi:hypothetical protein